MLLGFALVYIFAGPVTAGSPAHEPVAAASAQEPPATVLSKPIPYKKEESGTGAAASQSIIILAVLLGLTWGGLMLAKRYLPQWRLKLPLHLSPNAERRLKVIETMRLGPRSSLYLVQLDQKTLLLAQSGDNIIVAATDSDAGGTDKKDHDVAKYL
jgi:hypothetical protein